MVDEFFGLSPMSIRRRSCDACYNGRRKCDLSFPTCQRCQRNKKICHYKYPSYADSHPGFNSHSAVSPPQIVDQNSLCKHGRNNSDVYTFFKGESTGSRDVQIRREMAQSTRQGKNIQHLELSEDVDALEHEILSKVPNFVGPLGELRPLSGTTRSWFWVIEQLKSIPRHFVQHRETIFMHRQLYHNSLPETMRVALAVSATSILKDVDRPALFQALETSALQLLKPHSSESLLEELSRLHALTLYQIIRLFHGDLQQRITAELQESVIANRSLQLLQRANKQSQGHDWYDWVLRESIRRTVMTAFMLHAVYSIFRHGTCLQLPTMRILPVSITPKYWESRSNYVSSDDDDTKTYIDFTESWLLSPPRFLEPFEKILLVACKGLHQVEALSLPVPYWMGKQGHATL